MSKPGMPGKSGVSRLLDRVFSPWRIEAAVCAVLAAVPYVLFCVFSVQEQKTALTIAAPFVALGMTAFVYFGEYALRRYDRLNASFTLVSGVLLLAAGLALFVYFLTDVRQNFSFWLPACFAGLCMLALCNSKR